MYGDVDILIIVEMRMDGISHCTVHLFFDKGMLFAIAREYDTCTVILELYRIRILDYKSKFMSEGLATIFFIIWT